ncbi:WD-40 repeat-containing protein, partial [Reticulomyxa filosa]
SEEEQMGDIKQSNASFSVDTNFDLFHSSKLFKTLSGHTGLVRSIDYSSFEDCQFLCSGSSDSTVCVWDVENNKQIQTFNDHSNSVSCVKFSPYHRHNHRRNVICSASWDKTIRFWNMDTATEVQRLDEQTGVTNIQFSTFHNGRYLCSASGDKSIRLWDIQTSKQLCILNGHTNKIRCVEFSSIQDNNNNNNNNNSKDNNKNFGLIGGAGYTICSGSLDKTIRLWDVETFKEMNIFEGHEHLVASVRYLPYVTSNHGYMLYSASTDKTVRLWDIRSKKEIHVFKGHTGAVYCVEHLPYANSNCYEIGDANVICSASSDNTIRFWDIRNQKQSHMMKGSENDDGIICLQFLPGNRKKTVLFYVMAHTVVEFGFGNNKLIQFVTSIHSQLIQLTKMGILLGTAHTDENKPQRTYSSEVKTIIQNWLRTLNIELGWIKDFDKVVIKYAKSFRISKVLQGQNGVIKSVKFSTDGRKIVSASDEAVEIWDVALGKQIQIFRGHSDWVYNADFSPDGNIVVSCSGDKTARLWDATSGKELIRLSEHFDPVWDVDFAPDGNTVASGSYDKTIRIWDVKSGKEIQRLVGNSVGTSNVQYSPDGQMIVSSSKGTNITLWNVTFGEKLKELKGHIQRVTRAKFSPDGQFVISCSSDKTIRIWDIETGQELKKLEGHLDVVNEAQYFPNGQTIVSCSNDNTVRLWDTKSGREIQTLEGHSFWVIGVDVSSDGNTIVSCSFDKTIRIWE